VSSTPLSPPAKYQVDGLQAEVVIGLHVEAQPAGDVLVSPRYLRATRMADCVSGWTRQYGASSRTHRLQGRAIRCSGLRYCLCQPHIYPPLSAHRLLPAGRDQIVDDVRLSDQEITPISVWFVNPNSLPRSADQQENGIPDFVTVTSVTVSPPITAFRRH